MDLVRAHSTDDLRCFVCSFTPDDRCFHEHFPGRPVLPGSFVVGLCLRIVQAEAGICDPKGKILVADVIINRVLSGKFPDSVKAVVYQPSQFQPVSNGTINTVKVTAETIECVDRALAGEDYSNGALYFMNRRASGSAASWFDRRLTYLFAHDGHEFFR